MCRCDRRVTKRFVPIFVLGAFKIILQVSINIKLFFLNLEKEIETDDL